MAVQIQATGKLPKLAQLIGVLSICATPIACTTNAYDTAVWLFLIGIWVLGRFAGWWLYG